MFVWVRKRLPDHPIPRRLRNRYLATGLTTRRAIRQVASLTLAAVVAATVFGAVSSADDQRRSWGEARPVLTATRTIEAGQVLAGADLATKQVPVALIPHGAITARTSDGGGGGGVGDDVVGRRAVARINDGEILTDSDVAGDDDGRISGLLGDGESAVTVSVDADGPVPAAGDVVDIYGSPASDPLTTGGRPMLRLSAGARVLDVNGAKVTVVVDQGQVAAVLTAEADGRIALVTTR